MPLGRMVSEDSRSSSSHKSTAEFLNLPGVDQLFDWYRSNLFRPYWVTFNDGYLKPTRSTAKDHRMERGPSLQTIISIIDHGENGGRQRFSSAEPDVACWGKDDWYAYIIFKIMDANTHNRAGLFFRQTQSHPTAHYGMANCALRNYIRYVNTSPQNPIIPDSAGSQSGNGMNDVINTEGVSVVWKNANDPSHGYPLEAEDTTETLFHVPLAFMLETTAAIRNRVRAYFGFDAMELEIARLFFQEQNEDGVTTTQLTNSIWTKVRSLGENDRGRIFLLVETRNARGKELRTEQDSSLDDLSDTSDVLDEDGEYRGEHVNQTLNFTGTDDPAYTAMVREREREGGDWSLAHRICQYDTLFDIACLTQAKNPNADVAWETETLTDMDIREANHQSNAWRKQLELLGEVGDNDGHRYREEAAAAGTLQFQDITQTERLAFSQQELWLDNTRLQRENEDEAYSGLGISNRVRPHILGMNRNTILKFWQVVAVWAVYKFHNGYLKGGVLADAVGLGKTIVVLSLIQFKHNIRNTVATTRHRLARYGQPKATMIVVPPTLIPQWIDAIGEHLPEFTLCLYYGSLADNTQDEKRRIIHGFLHKAWFDKNEDISKCIILTSYKTMARRHGPGTLEMARKSKVNLHNSDEVKALKAKWTIPDRNWTRDLSGCIGDLYLDEGHAIKGGEAISSFVALKWLSADYTTIVTATPMINNTSDFEGILGMLQRENLWTDDQLQRLGVDKTFNPFTDVQDPTHESRWLRCTPQAIRKFVSHRDIDVVTKGTRLLLAMEMCVIKRGYGSRIPFGPEGRRIGDAVKPMQVRTIELKYREDELERYKPLHNFAIDNLPKAVDGPDGGKIAAFDMKHWRSLKHYSTWLGFEYLLKFHVDKLQDFREDHYFTLRSLAAFICEHNPGVQPPGGSLTDLLQWFANGSPKLRWMCWVLAELTVKRREKMVIWVQFPWQQELLYLFIKEFGIDVRQYHSGLGSRERQQLVRNFHEKPHKAMVLIGSYSVNSCGLNLHGYCRNVLIFEPGPSSPVEFQAIGRVYRIGQEQTVRVIRLYLQQSWNEWEEGNGLVKELPALMAELNMNIFGANEDPDADPAVSLGDRDISIKRYVLFDNRLVPAKERPGLEALSTEELLKHISRMLKDQRNFRSKLWKQL